MAIERVRVGAAGLAARQAAGALALLIGNVAIYVPGLAWLGTLYGWDKPILEWGLTPFLVGDVIKLALAAMLLPTLWKLTGKARG